MLFLKNRLVLLFFIFAAILNGQKSDPFFTENQKIHLSDTTIWKEIVGNSNFNEDLPPREPLQKERKTSESSLPWAKIIKFLLLTLGIGGILYLVYKLTGTENILGKKDQKLPLANLSVQVENLEENLPESDMEAVTEQALEQENFPLAIRLYYLRILQALHQQNDLVWKKEKTNLDYMDELALNPKKEAFIKVTKIYERVWYGKNLFGKAEFYACREDFLALLNKSQEKQPV